MILRKRVLKTDLLYTSVGEPIQDGMLIVSGDGIIEEVGVCLKREGVEEEYFPGALCAGFVNTHCHLELSHLKGKVSQQTGINGFIQELQQIRNAPDEEKLKAIQLADDMMRQQGIVAVGDIANGNITMVTKKQSNIYYHSFVELFGFAPEKANEVFSRGAELKKMWKEKHLATSIIPHSPYSVSEQLFQLIREEENNTPLSIHNQESAAENEMFQEGSGKMVDMLKYFGNDLSQFSETGKTSLLSYLNKLPDDTPLLLVHNTFTSAEDIAEASALHSKLYWCLCPKANLYIENRLPNIPQFIEAGVRCTLGTDSLASNNSLSIWEEIQTIREVFPQINLNKLIQWATINGAEFLGIADELGSLEQGKKAKINWMKEGTISPLF